MGGEISKEKTSGGGGGEKLYSQSDCLKPGGEVFANKQRVQKRSKEGKGGGVSNLFS